MRVAPLGNAAVTSLLLEHEGCVIVLDSPAVPLLAIQGSNSQHHLQKQKAHIQLCVPDYAAAISNSPQQLHAVLVTSAWGMLGLPHLQQLLQKRGLDLPIHTYCTEPCLHFLQQLSQELLDADACLCSTLQQQQQQQQQGLGQVPAAHQLHDQLSALHQQVQLLCQQPQQQRNRYQQHQQQQHNLLQQAGAFNSAGTFTPAVAPDAELPAGLVTVPLFSQQQLQQVLDAVTVVRYGQRLQLPGCFGVTAEARPSGSGIGTCMWVMTCGDQRYTYLGPASLSQGPSMPLHVPSVTNLDVLLVAPGSLSSQPYNTTHVQQQQQQHQRAGHQGPAGANLLAHAVGAAAAAVARGGRVLVPVTAGEGAVLQLLDHLPAALAAAGVSAQLVYMSPAAADTLATANSCCEYLEQQRQQRVLECGIAPFSSDQLLKAGQLLLLAPQEAVPATAVAAAAEAPVGAAAQAAAAAAAGAGGQPMCVDSPEQPVRCSQWGPLVQQVLQLGPACVVFVPLWSLAAGPGAMLAKAWCGNPNNLLLLPESGLLSASWLQQCLDRNLLPPQVQWQWQVQYVPLTTSLSAASSSASTAAATDAAATPGSGSFNACSSSGIGSRVVAAAMQHTPQGGLTAWELLSLLTHAGEQQQSQRTAGIGGAGGAAGRLCRIVAFGADAAVLSAALHEQESNPAWSRLQLVTLPPTPQSSRLTHGSIKAGVTALQHVQLQLPPPLLQASMTAELAERLQLQRLRISRKLQQPTAAGPSSANALPVQCQVNGQSAEAAEQEKEVFIARVQALLTHRSGRWRLEPLPTGPRPEAVSAVLAVQQQPQQALLWGSIDTAQLLADLQVAGFQAEVLAPKDNGSKPPAEQQVYTLVSVDGGVAMLRLSPHETEVVCDDAAMRRQLLQCLRKQLHHVG